MPTFRARRVRRGERGIAQAKDLDWDGARVFLEIARLGSLRSAAAALNQSVNALRRKLDNLEQGLGTKLLTRHVDGVRLTAEGTRVLTAAERMESAAFDALRSSATEDAQSQGEVNLAVTEGLGTFWIAPRLAQFQDNHPGIQVNLHCSMAKSDILRLESDVAIQLERPQAKEVKIVKLGRLHLMPFASPDYIARYGAPKSPAELQSHRLMTLAASQIPTPDEYFSRFGHTPVTGEIMLRINVSSAHYFALINGAGIGLLPTYAYNLSPPIVPLDCGYRSDQDIWLTYHPDVMRIARVQILIDWLRELFSPRTNPWFDDRFLHPNEFRAEGKRTARPRRD